MAMSSYQHSGAKNGADDRVGAVRDSLPSYDESTPADGSGLAVITDGFQSTARSRNGPNTADITASFAHLKLGNAPKQPDADTCLAHLKLLIDIQTLKTDVGYT